MFVIEGDVDGQKGGPDTRKETLVCYRVGERSVEARQKAKREWANLDERRIRDSPLDSLLVSQCATMLTMRYYACVTLVSIDTVSIETRDGLGMD